MITKHTDPLAGVALPQLEDPFDGGPSMEDLFPIGAKVTVLWRGSSKPHYTGEIVGHAEGLVDFGDPESGPGPLEEADLVIVRSPGGRERREYVGDVEIEDWAA